MAKEEGGAAQRTVEAPPPETESIVWREDKGRFETPDGEAFLQYRLFHGHGGGAAPAAAVMDMVHTYVPRSKRGQGLAARLCDAAFAHARGRGMRVLPTCSYISVSNHRPASPPPMLYTNSSPAPRFSLLPLVLWRRLQEFMSRISPPDLAQATTTGKTYCTDLFDKMRYQLAIFFPWRKW
jgi:GNAT superfamily N-acetyltransferase